MAIVSPAPTSCSAIGMLARTKPTQAGRSSDPTTATLRMVSPTDLLALLYSISTCTSIHPLILIHFELLLFLCTGDCTGNAEPSTKNTGQAGGGLEWIEVQIGSVPLFGQ